MGKAITDSSFLVLFPSLRSSRLLGCGGSGDGRRTAGAPLPCPFRLCCRYVQGRLPHKKRGRPLAQSLGEIAEAGTVRASRLSIRFSEQEASREILRSEFILPAPVPQAQVSRVEGASEWQGSKKQCGELIAEGQIHVAVVGIFPEEGASHHTLAEGVAVVHVGRQPLVQSDGDAEVD